MNPVPHVIDRRADGNRLEIDLYVRGDGPWFDGHFPEQPILPGVVHISSPAFLKRI